MIFKNKFIESVFKILSLGINFCRLFYSISYYPGILFILLKVIQVYVYINEALLVGTVFFGTWSESN